MSLPTKRMTFDEMRALMYRIADLYGCKITLDYPDFSRMIFHGKSLPWSGLPPDVIHISRAKGDEVFYVPNAKEKP